MNVLHVPLSKRKADWGLEGDATRFCKEVRGFSTTLQCCNRHASLFVKPFHFVISVRANWHCLGLLLFFIFSVMVRILNRELKAKNGCMSEKGEKTGNSCLARNLYGEQ